MITAKTKRKSIFDTRFDTKKIFVTAKHRFFIRGDYQDKNGNSIVYLDISDSKKRIRLNTEIYIPTKSWDKKKQRIINHANAPELNLVLDNINSRLTQIKTNYLLQDRILDAPQLVEEFKSNTPDFDFIAFCKYHLKLEDFKHQTIKNHNSVINKLEKFMPEIPFYKINMELLKKYRKHYPENSEITYNTDLKVIKKYLRIAVKKGIKINLNLDDLRVNVQSNKTVYLVPAEVQQLIKYYFNEFTSPMHQLCLGYFLFSCYTGLRVSDVLARNRNEVLSDFFQFQHVKTGNFQSMKINDDARKLIIHNEDLFIKFPEEQTINRELKTIATRCKIKKNISMHIGRHTFATAYIRNSGNIIKLQRLLGHSNIRHTLKYVHLVEGEVLEDMDLLKF